MPRKEVALVRAKHGYKLKQYSPNLIKGIKDKYAAMYDLILEQDKLPSFDGIPEELCPGMARQIKAANKVIACKRREYERQNQPFPEMPQDAALAEYLNNATFIKTRNTPYAGSRNCKRAI